MRYLIWVIKSAFCNHDWHYEEKFSKIVDSEGDIYRQGEKVSATCKKCGWHRTYWKQ